MYKFDYKWKKKWKRGAQFWVREKKSYPFIYSRESEQFPLLKLTCNTYKTITQKEFE